MYQLLIFDWDGTLIDSAGRIVSSMQRAASAQGLAPRGDAAIRNIIGLGLPEALDALYPGIEGEEVEAMRERYSRYYLAEDEPPASLFTGVEAGLGRLRDSGYTLAVATGKSRRGLVQVFEETGLGELFHLSRCADETRSKPHPMMLEEILAETGHPVESALMIGDTEYDLEMASRAGMASVGVSYGVHEQQRLLRHAPQTVIHRFAELETWLEGQKNQIQPQAVGED
ncbi:HAD-IA family hydrolase [Motiliproteus sp. SC1-56]|uniref:HAD-IA family hydrolase n=1 Tax=Motiliproteus sp. SC1-56 TaxID=2799565 RepID=UPI001A8C150C|nr:HAD-IA family hydrolase [Motiliproteus sp. SC1-56]